MPKVTARTTRFILGLNSQNGHKAVFTLKYIIMQNVYNNNQLKNNNSYSTAKFTQIPAFVKQKRAK